MTWPDHVSLPPLAWTIQVPGESVPYLVMLANGRLYARVAPPAFTVTWCSFSDAWMTRTSDLPLGVFSRSSRTWSRSALFGPTPATV